MKPCIYLSECIERRGVHVGSVMVVTSLWMAPVFRFGRGRKLAENITGAVVLLKKTGRRS